MNTDRVRIADGVGELNFAARRQTGGHDVLRDLAAHVSRAAIHLGRVLAGERAAAVTAHAAVAVDDDLAAGQTGVALRSADDETAGRIDEKLRLLVSICAGKTFLMISSMTKLRISGASRRACAAWR